MISLGFELAICQSNQMRFASYQVRIQNLDREKQCRYNAMVRGINALPGVEPITLADPVKSLTHLTATL